METKSRVEVERRRFTAEEYHRMGEAGVFGEGERVELIEGEVVALNPIGGRHAMCVRELTWLIGRRLSEEFRLDVQNPVGLEENWEPQPDLAVIRTRDYADELPGAGDILILIEVSDTTLRYDREIKLPFYAKTGIPEVWIADPANETMERHSNLSGSDYRRMERARRGEELASEVLPSVLLRTDDIFGKPS